MQPKITMRQFEAMLFDPTVPDNDLRPYLRQSDLHSRSFEPALAIDESKVAASDAESALVVNGFNGISRFRRQERYRLRIEGGWRGKRLVSEGDSWFQFPMLLDDVIDALDPDFAIWSMGGAGDHLGRMNQEEILHAIQTHQPDAFLISGGGNDLLSDGTLAVYLDDFDPGREPDAHINDEFGPFLHRILDLYLKLFTRVARAFPRLPVLCHGYDNAKPAGGPWLGTPMEAKAITDRSVQATIVAAIMARFNAGLAGVAEQFPQVHYLDCRGRVTAWHDELHPDNAGYAKVADRFRDCLSQVLT